MGGETTTDEDRVLTQDDVDPAEFGCLGSGPACSPFRAPHSYFCFDNPAALAQEFKNDLGLEGSSFMLLYSLYSWPNVFLCFIGGYLIDRVFGIRLGAFLFGVVVTVGQLVFALGAYIDSKAVMYAGRFIFGLGGENLAVAANTYVVSWFAGKEINMVFGINLSASRMGSTVGMVSLSPIYKALSTKFQGTHLMGVVLTIGEMKYS
eukprot:sb/3470442/